MQVRQKFATNGYVIFFNAVHEATVDTWKTLARRTTNWCTDLIQDNTRAPTMQNGDEDQVDEEGLIADEGRLQSVVPDQEARNISRSLKRFYRTFFINSSAHDWRFIKAVPGTIEPPPRRDFASVPEGASAMDVTAVAGSIIVATEDDTCFYGYGWGHNVALRSNRRLFEMSKGDILLYRGDFILAPVAYETKHLCLHAYLDTPFTERPHNHHPHIVQEVDDLRCTDDPFCFVWKCTFKGTPLAIRRHMNRFHGIRFRRLPRSALP